MKQSSQCLGKTASRTRRREFRDKKHRVVPWADLLSLVLPYVREGKHCCPPFLRRTLLFIHFMQKRFAISDPAMEEVQHGMAVFREFAGMEACDERLPEESTILRVCHVLERQKLDAQTTQTVNTVLSANGVMLGSATLVDATLIAAPSSIKDSSGERDPEIDQSHTRQRWCFGMNYHIGAYIELGMARTVKGTGVTVNDVIEVNCVVCPSDRTVYADGGYQGAGKRPDARGALTRAIAMRPGKRRMLDLAKPMDAPTEHMYWVKVRVTSPCGAPVPYAQAPFRPCQRVLPWVGQSLDGAPSIHQADHSGRKFKARGIQIRVSSMLAASPFHRFSTSAR